MADTADPATGTVTVHVTLHGDVRRLRPRDAPDRAPVAVPGGTVAGLLAHLGVRPDEPLIIAVNGEVVPRTAALCPGDEVLLSTPMEGG
jgi:sulfur carrier protein ThiS